MSSMTGNPRVFIWIALALVLWLNWEAWMRDYAPATPPTPVASTQNGSPAVPPPASLGSSVPQASTSASPASAADKTPAPATGSTAASAPTVEATGAAPSGGKVHVLTDVLD